MREPAARDRLLEKRGHRVVMTANGREALEALAKDKFDLVLMDGRCGDGRTSGYLGASEKRKRER